MKKIALFISSLQKGGSERVMVNLAEYFYRNNYEVILVTQYKKEDEYEISPQIKRVYSEPDENKLNGGRIKNFITRFFTLRDIWKKYKPDIVLAFLGKNNLMAIATSFFLPNKVVVSVRGEPTMEYEGKLMQTIAKFMFNFADGIVLQTERAKDFFGKKVKNKSVILLNPLNPAFLDVKYVGEKRDRIVAVGRIDENKNQEMLIHAFDKIATEYPQVSLSIYGDGCRKDNIAAMIKEKKLEDRIILEGNVTDVAEKIKDARIFTLTSNTEGMPNSLMEAMALGLVVISTDCPCGGPATLIQNGENGILIPVGDAYALADALRQVLADKVFADRLGENAYESSKKFDPEIVNKEWEDFLIKL